CHAPSRCGMGSPLPVRFYPLDRRRASNLPLLFSESVETLFYVLAISQILLGVYLIWQGLQWLGYVRRRLHPDPGFYAPRVAVLCPCKGIEPGLERNLISLTEFERQNYEIFFILASDKDPARSIIDRVAKNSRVKSRILIAGKAVDCGEKVNNL